MTIDGNFNANYIQSGRIRADIFETSFNAVGDQLKLVKGALQIVNSNKKIHGINQKRDGVLEYQRIHWHNWYY